MPKCIVYIVLLLIITTHTLPLTIYSSSVSESNSVLDSLYMIKWVRQSKSSSEIVFAVDIMSPSIYMLDKPTKHPYIVLSTAYKGYSYYNNILIADALRHPIPYSSGDVEAAGIGVDVNGIYVFPSLRAFNRYIIAYNYYEGKLYASTIDYYPSSPMIKNGSRIYLLALNSDKDRLYVLDYRYYSSFNPVQVVYTIYPYDFNVIDGTYTRLDDYETYKLSVWKNSFNIIAFLVDDNGYYYIGFMKIDDSGRQSYTVGPLSSSTIGSYVDQKNFASETYDLGYGYAVLCNGSRLLVYNYETGDLNTYSYTWMSAPARLKLIEYNGDVIVAILSQTSSGVYKVSFINVDTGAVINQHDLSSYVISIPNINVALIQGKPYALVACEDRGLIIGLYEGVVRELDITYGRGVFMTYRNVGEYHVVLVASISTDNYYAYVSTYCNKPARVTYTEYSLEDVYSLGLLRHPSVAQKPGALLAFYRSSSYYRYITSYGLSSGYRIYSPIDTGYYNGALAVRDHIVAIDMYATGELKIYDYYGSLLRTEEFDNLYFSGIGWAVENYAYIPIVSGDGGYYEYAGFLKYDAYSYTYEEVLFPPQGFSGFYHSDPNHYVLTVDSSGNVLVLAVTYIEVDSGYEYYLYFMDIEEDNLVNTEYYGPLPKSFIDHMWTGVFKQNAVDYGYGLITVLYEDKLLVFNGSLKTYDLSDEYTYVSQTIISPNYIGLLVYGSDTYRLLVLDISSDSIILDLEIGSTITSLDIAGISSNSSAYVVIPVCNELLFIDIPSGVTTSTRVLGGVYVTGIERVRDSFGREMIVYQTSDKYLVWINDMWRPGDLVTLEAYSKGYVNKPIMLKTTYYSPYSTVADRLVKFYVYSSGLWKYIGYNTTNENGEAILYYYAREPGNYTFIACVETGYGSVYSNKVSLTIKALISIELDYSSKWIAGAPMVVRVKGVYNSTTTPAANTELSLVTVIRGCEMVLDSVVLDRYGFGYAVVTLYEEGNYTIKLESSNPNIVLTGDVEFNVSVIKAIELYPGLGVGLETTLYAPRVIDVTYGNATVYMFVKLYNRYIDPDNIVITIIPSTAYTLAQLEEGVYRIEFSINKTGLYLVLANVSYGALYSFDIAYITVVNETGLFNTSLSVILEEYMELRLKLENLFNSTMYRLIELYNNTDLRLMGMVNNTLVWFMVEANKSLDYIPSRLLEIVENFTKETSMDINHSLEELLEIKDVVEYIADKLNESLELSNISGKLDMIIDDIALLDTRIGYVLANITDLRATTIAVHDNILVVNTTLGLVIAYLEDLNSTISEVGRGFIIINTTIGVINSSLKDIDYKLVLINETMARIEALSMEVNVSLSTIISGYLEYVNESVAYIKTVSDEIVLGLSMLNATLVDVYGEVVLVKTSVGYVLTNLSVIDAKIDSISQSIVDIETILGSIETEIDDIAYGVEFINETTLVLHTVLGDLVNRVDEINNTLSWITGVLVDVSENILVIETYSSEILSITYSINYTIEDVYGSMAVIKTDLGYILATLDNVDASIKSINGSLATISTMFGKVVIEIDDIAYGVRFVNDSVAVLSTSIGEIAVNVEELIKDLGLLNNSLNWIAGVITSVKDNIALIITKTDVVSKNIDELNISIATIKGDLAILKTSIGYLLINTTILESIYTKLSSIEEMLQETNVTRLVDRISSVEKQVSNIRGEAESTRNLSIATSGVSVTIALIALVYILIRMKSIPKLSFKTILLNHLY